MLLLIYNLIPMHVKLITSDKGTSGARRTKAYNVPIQRYRNPHAKIEDSKIHILWSMGSKFCVKFQRCSLKFYTRFWTHTPPNAEVRSWLSNYITYKTIHEITYPYPNLCIMFESYGRYTYSPNIQWSWNLNSRVIVTLLFRLVLTGTWDLTGPIFWMASSGQKISKIAKGISQNTCLTFLSALELPVLGHVQAH